MTRTDSPKSGGARLRRMAESLGGQTVLLLLWGLICFALCDGTLLAEKGREALLLCIRQIIPVLFPIAAAGGLLTLFAPPPRFLCRPIRGLFRLSDASVGVLLIALISGFPIGAMLSSRLLEAGRIEKEEASRLAAYTNNASAAFLVGCVGAGFFGSARLGWILWFASTVSALLVGVWMARHVSLTAQTEEREHPLPTPGELAKSLKATGLGMLNLTVFVMFFAVFCAFLNRALSTLLPETALTTLVKAIVAAFFEITGGLSAIARLSLDLPLRMMLAGMASGFGGLSVFMQCMATGKAVRGRRLLITRLAIGILSGILALLLTLLLG